MSKKCKGKGCQVPCGDSVNPPCVPPQIGYTVVGKVERVVDGDTLEVVITKKLKVRLLDCWAPEMKEAGGPESKAFMQNLVEGREVYLLIPGDEEEFGNFTFGRVLGRVLLKTESGIVDVSKESVGAGHSTISKPRPT